MKGNKAIPTLEGEDAERFEANMREAEKTMIDLSKNQTFDEPVECWVRDKDCDEWVMTELFSIENRGRMYPYRSKRGGFMHCTLTDPNKPEVKKHSHDDLIIGASKKGWVFQDTVDKEISTYWSSMYTISRFRVAYEYNGADTVWYDMEEAK